MNLIYQRTERYIETKNIPPQQRPIVGEGERLH